MVKFPQVVCKILYSQTFSIVHTGRSAHTNTQTDSLKTGCLQQLITVKGIKTVLSHLMPNISALQYTCCITQDLSDN